MWSSKNDFNYKIVNIQTYNLLFRVWVWQSWMIAYNNNQNITVVDQTNDNVSLL